MWKLCLAEQMWVTSVLFLSFHMLCLHSVVENIY